MIKLLALVGALVLVALIFTAIVYLIDNVQMKDKSSEKDSSKERIDEHD